MAYKKIFDCITFFDENFLTNLRFEILDKVVDYFIICESKFDHKGIPKKINFRLINPKFKKKVRHIVIDKQFPHKNDGWKNESFQREKIFDGIKDAKEDDYIIFSDSDEIPNPKKLKNFKMKKKFGIFLQNFYVYKMNIFNKYESPWEGSRICKKKDLKSFTYLRKKILKKNIAKSSLKFYIEKSIQIINHGGWHFNNLYKPEQISKKIKTFQHIEFNNDNFTNIRSIKKKIKNLEDLFDRGHKFKKVKIDKSYPVFLLKNKKKMKKYIL
tara:strand:+ start:886 stop:1695 length:810 start_codon:yes stop_codon:yes gene_type:complete